jgi:hypothetical protein
MGKGISYSNGVTDRQTLVFKSANSRFYSMNADMKKMQQWAIIGWHEGGASGYSNFRFGISDCGVAAKSR